MKTPIHLLTALLMTGALALTSCDNKPAESAETSTQPAAATDNASGDMAGMDHSTMNHGETSGGPMMMAMNNMMQQMHATKPKGNTDHDFAHMMMDHHRGAVEMAAVELRDGKDAMLRQMAEKISADQKKEIQELEQIATRLDDAPTNYQPTNPSDPFQRKMTASMDGMMKNMPQESGNVDQDFAAMMIPHHQSAIDMAQAELDHGRDTRLKEMAQQMINAQQQEIKQLQDWLTQHGAGK
ncbi:DUF305 domain-containing protein [Hymenobacter jeollabukensis]|uniref:DUF305 domain-containing protein n=1 Tax=Hymenobacter jeollabukensis TaxID=2025313 RepID=A0A5R8WJI8_9BACT|nr:DUF305 domain-containing protein [Hymenobacter jeollabukensis]TLM88773.1 DUF305 domain-containing protein [Hymenobacter jeollabukensis]